MRHMQEIDLGGARELWRAAKSAQRGVKALRQLAGTPLDCLGCLPSLKGLPLGCIQQCSQSLHAPNFAPGSKQCAALSRRASSIL